MDIQVNRDKEDILMEIIWELCSSQIIVGGQEQFDPAHWGDHAHFVYYRKPAAGDLVVCVTSTIHRVHEVTVAELLEVTEDPKWGESYLLRELGTDNIVNMQNEKIVPIAGVMWRKPEVE